MSGRASIPLLRIRRLRIRLHLLFILWAAGSGTLAVTVDAVPIGVAIGGVVAMFLAALVHEGGRALVAARQGVALEGTDLWPLGGLGDPPPTADPRARMWIALSGPLANCLCAFLILPYALLTDQANSVLLGTGPIHRDPSAVALFFGANCDLMLLHLLPAFPLDGALLCIGWIGVRIGKTAAFGKVILIGRFASVALLLVALFAPLGAAGRFGLALVAAGILGETERQRRRGHHEDPAIAPPPPESAWSAHWRRRRELREALRHESRARERVAEESRLDELLEKVHEGGIESLSREERRFLERIGKRYRDR